MAARARESTSSPKAGPIRERTLVLGLAAAILLAILAVSLFGPAGDDKNPNPTTFNSGSKGIKASYLLLSELGLDARRWESAPSELSHVDAARTTLILTEPILPVRSLDATKAQIAGFLARGGRVLATGSNGAALLPRGEVTSPTIPYPALCYTQPEGASALARAGVVAIADSARWNVKGPEFQVAQRCGSDAVVVRYTYGRGEAVWWSSPMPLTNSALNDGADLALVLASIRGSASGPRTILFDEYLHVRHESITDTLSGLPWGSLALQTALLAALLIFSFGRRNGPLRMPATLPRTSPIEFAESMGSLYRRANATSAPVDAVRIQTLRVLAESCGLSYEALRQPSGVIAETLATRIGGDWHGLAEHLDAARNAEQRAPTGKLALQLVQALEQDQRALAAAMQKRSRSQVPGPVILDSQTRRAASESIGRGTTR